MPSTKKLLAFSAAACLLAVFLPRLFAQQIEQGQTLKATVNLVNLYVTVRDHHKRIVTNLTKDDFRVFEDNQPQKIAFFSKEVTLPLTIGLLLDTSGSEQNMLYAIQDAGSRFLNRVMRKGDEAMVISFDTDVNLMADFTEDRADLDRAIHRTRINAPMQGGMINPGPFPAGNVTGTALYDAIYLACHDELASEAGRKAIIIVTDAEDEGSKTSLDQAVEAAQRTDTVIHIILVYDPRYGANMGAAKKLTEETGGRVIIANSNKKLEEAFDEISEELRSQYTVGYYPTNTAHDGKFRKVKVEMVDKDYKALTRKGYYAPRS
jgi:VWFA-related protein